VVLLRDIHLPHSLVLSLPRKQRASQPEADYMFENGGPYKI
jgi:hypothetical protein